MPLSYDVVVENKVNNSDNINECYRYANRKFNNKNLMGPRKSNDGTLLIDPTHKAELMQTSFASILTTDYGYISVVSTPPVIHVCAISHFLLC